MLLKRGYKCILMVVGEMSSSEENADYYYIGAIKAIYSADYEGSKIKRVNVNVAHMSVKGFKRLKEANIGT